MTAPLVTALPQAPSRLSRPSLFFPESTIFLDALPTYRSEVNSLSFYINSQILNKYNLGTLTGKRDFPDISQSMLTDVMYEGNSISFVSDVDSIYYLLEENSNKVNAVGVWIDEVIAEIGLVPYDTNKPLINGVVSPMYRGQTQEDFNSSASLFNQSAIDNLNSTYQSVWYTYQITCGNEDYGSVMDDTIILYEDAGSITDTNITY